MAGETASGGQTNHSNSGKLTAGLLGLIAVGLLLALMGFTFAWSAIFFVATSPLLLLFSPIVVPGAIAITGAMLAFGVCGATGLSGIWALKWALGRLMSREGDESGWAERVDQPSSDDRDVPGWTGQVSRAVTESGHRVKEQKRQVGGFRQREVQVKGAKG